MITTRRPRFDSSLERIMEVVSKEITSPVKPRFMGFQDSFFLMKTRGAVLPPTCIVFTQTIYMKFLIVSQG
jgi:hypothetical protein